MTISAARSLSASEDQDAIVLERAPDAPLVEQLHTIRTGIAAFGCINHDDDKFSIVGFKDLCQHQVDFSYRVFWNLPRQIDNPTVRPRWLNGNLDYLRTAM